MEYQLLLDYPDTKGKPLPRLSKHHQWTNRQLGVWSQRCSMLMHCPSMQVKSPSLFLFVCYYHLTEPLLLFFIRRKGDLHVVSFTVDISFPHLSSFTPEKFTLSKMTKTLSKNNKLGKEWQRWQSQTNNFCDGSSERPELPNKKRLLGSSDSGTAPWIFPGE